MAMKIKCKAVYDYDGTLRYVKGDETPLKKKLTEIGVHVFDMYSNGTSYSFDKLGTFKEANVDCPIPDYDNADVGIEKAIELGYPENVAYNCYCVKDARYVQWNSPAILIDDMVDVWHAMGADQRFNISPEKAIELIDNGDYEVVNGQLYLYV